MTESPTELRDRRPLGHGLFATADLREGTRVERFLGHVLAWRGGPEHEARHALLAPEAERPGESSPAWSVNHSCEPNATVDSELFVVTTRPVMRDEEITLAYDVVDAGDYGRSPQCYGWNPAWTFECFCGAPTCRKRIERWDVRNGPREVLTAFDHAHLRCGPVAEKGRGVFAERAFFAGELIERAPVIVVSPEHAPMLRATTLQDYIYSWTDDGSKAVALGWGSLYNHSTSPNAVYVKRIEQSVIEYLAHRPIARGDEITINYGGSPDSRPTLGFSGY